MMKYDPDRTPNPKEWLAMDEGERIEHVLAYHRRIRAKLPNARLHAAIHAIIENQLAEGLEVVRETLGRLRAEGLNRPEAMRAIGSVLAEHLWNVVHKEGKEPKTNGPYFQALRSLTARSWSGDAS